MMDGILKGLGSFSGVADCGIKLFSRSGGGIPDLRCHYLLRSRERPRGWGYLVGRSMGALSPKSHAFRHLIGLRARCLTGVEVSSCSGTLHATGSFLRTSLSNQVSCVYPKATLF